MRKVKGKLASIENVKRFFSNSPNDDRISLEEAFTAWGRNLEKPEDNKAWLSNLLYHLKYNDLIVPVYDFGEGRKKLAGLQLTLEGKRALGRIQGNSEDENRNPNSNGKLSLDDIVKAIPRVRKENPEFEITFDLKLKEKPGVLT